MGYFPLCSFNGGHRLLIQHVRLLLVGAISTFPLCWVIASISVSLLVGWWVYWETERLTVLCISV
jgi:hypothetical protein